MALGVERVLSGITKAFTECSKAAMEYESALTGVYKTVDGTDVQLAQINDDIKAMALEIPSTTTEIAGVAESAGQLGIATEDVMDFTEVMINLDEATNLSSDEAASSLAKFSNITGMAAENYDNLGSTVVALGNNFATTEADIVSMATRMASAGTLAGLTESDILGLAAAMSSVGIEAEAGGSAMSKLMTDIQVAVETGNDSLNDFASVAGMTAEQFSDVFENRAVDALNAFITGLNDVERNGQTATVILENMGITEVRLSNAVKSLASNSDGLSGAVRLASDAWTENTALADEAGKRYGTLESRLTITKNAANNLKIAVGDALNPVVGTFADMGTDALTWLTEFCEENPAVVASISGVVGALTLAGTAVAGYTIAVKAANAATKVFNTTLSAGKIFSVAGAVAAVGGVIGALAYKFTTAKDKVEDYNGTLEQCRNEIESTETSYKNVCAMYGENSQAAQSLAAELDTLNKQYEKGGGIVEEYSQRLAESTEKLNKLRTEYNDKLNDIADTETSGMIAVANLEALSEKAKITNGDLDLMSYYANYLNDTFNCNIVVDYDTGKLTGFNPNDINSIMDDMAKNNRTKASMDYLTSTDFQDSFQEKFKVYESARHKKENYDASWRFHQIIAQAELDTPQDNTNNSLIDKFSTGYDNTSDIDVSEIEGLDENLRNAEKDLQGLYSEIYSEFEKMGYGTDEANIYIRSLKEDAIQSLNETACGFDLMSRSVEESRNSITTSEEAMAYGLSTVSDEILELNEAYEEAYNAAYESFQGQFGLFEEAQASADATVENAQKALDSQLAYWTEYGNNISFLSNLSAESLGITQENYDAMMTYVRSGDEQAAGLASSMVEAINQGKSDAVTELANTIGEIDSKQTEIANTTALWQTDYETNLNKFIGDAKTAVEKLDMADDTKRYGLNSIDAFAHGIRIARGNAVREAESVVESVKSVFNNANISLKIPSVTSSNGTNSEIPTVTRNAVGTTYSDDVFIAGDEGPELIIGKKGSTVFPADETNRIISAVTENKPLFIPPAESPVKSLGSRTETVSRHELAIDINGKGSISVEGSMDKEQVVEVLFDYLKPALMNILSQDIFEEGDNSYEF